NRQTSRRNVSGEMRAQEIFTWWQRAKLEATALIRDRNRRRRPNCGNDGVCDRLTVIVFYGAENGAGRLRSTHDRCGGRLGLRRSEQWCAESDQTADCRRRHESGCPCHIELRGSNPDFRAYEPVTVKFTSRVSVLLAILSVTLISSR